MRLRNAGAEVWLCALALSLALPAPAQAQMREVKTFRDWIAGCDNTRTCTALSLPAEAAENIAYLRLERPAGEAGRPVLKLRLRPEEAKPPLALRLVLDGAAFPAGGGALAATRTEDEALSVTFAPDQAEALIAAARKATKLTATLAGKRYEVSLAGSVAAMLWIDEAQGRLNTPSALVRRGTVGAAPAGPALPVVEAHPAGRKLEEKQGKAIAASLRRQLRKLDPDHCSAEPGEVIRGNDQAWALGPRLDLVALGCGNGAYNSWTGFWTVTGGDVASAKPVRFQGGEGSDGNLLVNAGFDPDKATLSYFAKGRGLGDCGTNGTYVWTGTAFAESQTQTMGECRMIGWDDWITLYRSEVRIK